MATNNFYEDDEPDDKIRAAFKQGEKGRTARPRDLNQRAAEIVSDSTAKTEPNAIQFAAVDEVQPVEVTGLTFEEHRPVRITRRADVTIRS